MSIAGPSTERMIPARALGLTNTKEILLVCASPQGIGRGCRNFLGGRLGGLADGLHPRNSHTYDHNGAAGLINRALKQWPQDAAHWSVFLLGH